MQSAKLFFITGVSSGFGPGAGRRGRSAPDIGWSERYETRADRAQFEALSPGQCFGRVLDVTDFAAIPPLVDAVEREIGAVDVLVNNAGYGHEGIMEESPLQELVAQFQRQRIGAVAMIKAFVPWFRARRAGHILNITSMGGFITLPGISYYCGSKFALQGISRNP
ncbi:Fatty acyl-CoA reductase [Raoultella terrigena]|uniref:Fatty acyl-CoA reductase n=1 Tax=Raoultella terrigena TaxID=577 RepID=A0A4U9CUJ1_RAOTE|nr:Fatty acyl-CoA reductase [Raoultella terrigena]